MSAWQYNQPGVTYDQIGLTYDGGFTELLGGGPGYNYVSIYHREQERRAKQDALEQLNKEIAVIEREEKPLIKKAKRNTEAEIRLLALRDEIIALRLEREALIRMIDDEEAIFILLAATPFN